MAGRKTRYERVAPVRAKRGEKPAYNAWEQKARLRHAFPFGERREVPEEEVLVPPMVTSRVNPAGVAWTTQLVIENALAQAYIDGYVAACRQLDIIVFAIQHHGVDPSLLREVRRLVRETKDDLADGKRGV